MQLFNVDLLGSTMLTLVWVIGLVVSLYSRNYMRLDRHYSRFMSKLLAIVASASILFISNQIVMTLCAWVVSNLLLVSLMAHVSHWREAQASAALARRALMLGSFFFAVAGALLVSATDTVYISEILSKVSLIPFAGKIVIASCLVLAAMLQAGLWPFQSWLISSLNSPAPVSALMHAGLINGGGYLLIRFSELYSTMPAVMTVIFLAGCISAVLGTGMKLVQNDVKRQLASSTMGQMGFMFILAGLGLYPVMLIHLVWHALFKANLFLSANSTLWEKKYSRQYALNPAYWLYSLLIAIASIALFYHGFHQPMVTDGWIFISILFACVIVQMAALEGSGSSRLFSAMLILLFAVFYGWYIAVVEGFLSPSIISMTYPLNGIHWLALAGLVSVWLVFLMKEPLAHLSWYKALIRRLYVSLLNMSQPHPSTVTVNKNSYHI